MKKSMCIVAMLLIPAGTAFAQSSGSGGGSFSNAYLIPTVACSAGSLYWAAWAMAAGQAAVTPFLLLSTRRRGL